MLSKIIVLFICFSAVFVASVSANPDSVIIPGDLRITGPGNSLVFPDGSVQYQSQIQGPVGPQRPAGATGATGPKGDSGTTNGITKAVHGTFGPDGAFTPGNGLPVPALMSFHLQPLLPLRQIAR